MPLLHDIDILPVEYPLFTWDEWPESLAALVQGGPTSAFRMACWNAMVMHLAEALEAAGLEWDPGAGIQGTGDRFVYPVDRVLIADGFLHGYQFNRMIANINGRIPVFHWLWATDESYRGYIGRVFVSEFPIVSAPNNLPDIVYPEYFTELVARMNQFIEIMRGSWPMNRISVSAAAATLYDENLMIRKSVPIAPHQASASRRGETPLDVLPGIPIPASKKSRLRILSDAGNGTAKTAGTRWVESRINTRFDGEVIRADWMNIKPDVVSSLAKTLVECLVMMETGAVHRAGTAAEIHIAKQPPAVTEGKLNLISWQEAGITKSPSVPTAARIYAESREIVDAGIVSSIAAGATGHACSHQKTEIIPFAAQDLKISWKTKTEETAVIRGSQSAALSAGEKSAVTAKTGLEKPQPLPTEAKRNSKIWRELTIIKNRSRPGWAEQNSGTGMDCTIVSAWDAPLLENGGLWIRQARTIKILADGSMDLSGSGDPIGAKQESSTIIVSAIGNAWLAPVWLEDGLYIRQVRQADVLEDGSLDLTGAGDEMAVRQGSGTRLSAALDTGWYPPVIVDGGLYLRQVYEDPVQNENGELEVR